MIKRVWNFLKGLKDWLDLIVKIVAVIGIITGVFGIKGCSKHKQEKNNAIEIMTSEVTQHKSRSGKLLTETINWDIKHNSLSKLLKESKKENSILIAQNSRFKQELIEANKTIEDLGIKAKNVQNYIKNELISKDSILTPFVIERDCKTVKIAPIDKKHIKINFVQKDDYLDVTYVYSASMKTVVSRYPELKGNGKKHFPNWGWLYGWDYKTTSTVDDPNASISNLVSIEFDK
jgi:hypothetical protein